MNVSKRMAQVITQIAQKHGVSLDVEGSHLKIENVPYMPLSIHVLTPVLVSVTHYYEQNGDLVPDPDMVFYRGYGDECGWIPVSIQHNTGRYAVATKIENDAVTAFYSREQADQASFANLWARNIKSQGFLQGMVARKVVPQD